MGGWAARPASQLVAGHSSALSCLGGEVAKCCVEVGLQVQKFFQTHQLHGLHNPGVTNHQKLLPIAVALLGKLHKGAKTGGVEEVDVAEIDHQRLTTASVRGHKFTELFVGIGIELASEAEQLAVSLLFEAPSQRHRQSLQVVDGSSPQSVLGRSVGSKFDPAEDATKVRQRRAAIRAAKRPK